MEDNDAEQETKFLENSPETSPLNVLYKIPCPGQFSTRPAQNLLVLARKWVLGSRTVMYLCHSSLRLVKFLSKKGSIMQKLFSSMPADGLAIPGASAKADIMFFASWIFWI